MRPVLSETQSPTFDFRCKHKVFGTSSTKKNHSITVLLIVRADGHKLPALIVFQEKSSIISHRIWEKLIIPNNVLVKATTSGYVNLNILKSVSFLTFVKKNTDNYR